MTATETDAKRQSAFIRTILKKDCLPKHCNACGGCAWVVEEVYCIERLDGPKSRVVEGILGFPFGSNRFFPVLPVWCGKCGNTHFFNAIVLGIVDRDGKICVNLDDEAVPSKWVEETKPTEVQP